MSHNIEFDNSIISSNLRRLINQIWKLLPMRENEEDWHKQLDIVLRDLYGLNSMFKNQLDFLILISQLEGLHSVLNFDIYRTTIFSSISILTELVNTLNGKS